MEVLHCINKSKFPVFLVKLDGMHFAMKIFPYVGDEIQLQYLNEIRFNELDHKNVVRILHTEDLQMVNQGKVESKSSYILMDLGLCDFSDLVEKKLLPKDEKFVRSYFHMLVDGVEYLHSQGIAHLDLKLENLLLGDDYQLKITDFDISYKKGDFKVQGSGSKNYGAPELRKKECRKPFQADIFSMGIILFLFQVGHLPYSEGEEINGIDLYQTISQDPETFWDFHQELSGGELELSQSFKDLFLSMVKRAPEERASIKKIKESAWYNEGMYSNEEITSFFKLK